MSRAKKERATASFSSKGMGQGTLSFSKNTQTRILTFDWRSENEHQEPASRLRCGPRRSFRCTRRRCGRDRRAGAGRIRSRLRRIRHELLLHSRHRNLPEGRRLRALRHRRWRAVRRTVVLSSMRKPQFDEGDDTWHKRARFQLRVDARTETELGTLRGYARDQLRLDDRHAAPDYVRRSTAMASSMQATSIWPRFNAGNNSSIEHAYVELGGFRIGVTELATSSPSRATPRASSTTA